MPTILYISLKGKLLCNCITQLGLVYLNKVDGRIVIIHQQVVLQILITGIGTEVKTMSFIFDGKSCVYHIAIILTLVVLIGFRQDCSALRLQYAIGISMLIYILIICHPVERESVRRLIYQTQSAACFVHIVSPLSCLRVFPESVSTVIECTDREGQLITYLIIMTYLCVTVHMHTEPQIDIRSLITQGILGILTYKSPFGIDTI